MEYLFMEEYIGVSKALRKGSQIMSLSYQLNVRNSFRKRYQTISYFIIMKTI